jgi:hypothetical protein
LRRKRSWGEMTRRGFEAGPRGAAGELR